MIDWLTRVESERPFLKTPDRVWTYGEADFEVNQRLASGKRVIAPGLAAEGVFDCLAAMSAGGAVIAGSGIDVPGPSDMQGADLVLFTSGTTGTPKGVRFSTGNLEAASKASMAHLGHGPDDTWLLAMGLHHVAGLSIVVRSAVSGGSVRMLPGFDAETFATAMRGEVTMVSVVPAMLHRILDQDAGPYPALRAVLVGGGPIPKGLLERAAEADIPVLPTYGMTETFGQVATLRPNSPLAYHAHPLPGVELRIGDDGRIEVKSDQISPGYLGEPDRESAWFTTSDIGEINPEGAVRILGRADTVIVTGGENVDPIRVESEIRSLGIEEVVVVGLPDDEWGSILVAVYSGEGSPEMVENTMKERLPRFMVPSRWVAVEELPTTELGKPDRPAAARLAGHSGP